MIRHPIYGCVIEGELPGPFRVTRGERLVGEAPDMREAILVAKREMREQASVWDYSASDAPERKG